MTVKLRRKKRAAKRKESAQPRPCSPSIQLRRCDSMDQLSNIPMMGSPTPPGGEEYKILVVLVSVLAALGAIYFAMTYGTGGM